MSKLIGISLSKIHSRFLHIRKCSSWKLNHVPNSLWHNIVGSSRSVHRHNRYYVNSIYGQYLWNAYEYEINSSLHVCWRKCEFIRLSINYNTWWRHQMDAFSALLALYAGNSRSPVNSPHKGQWRGALMLSLICARINGWVNNREVIVLRYCLQITPLSVSASTA